MTGHRSLGAGWGPALRIARREMMRAKGRTLLVLVMVLLPVTVVVGFDTLLRTSETSVVESLDRDLGGATARIDPQFGAVQQNPDGTRTLSDGAAPVALSPEQVASVLGPDAELLVLREGRSEVPVRTADGRTARVQLVGVDLRDPESRGPYRVLRGAAPARGNEVAVTPRVERFGFPVGSTLTLQGEPRTVAGVVEHPLSYGAPAAVLGVPQAVGLDSTAASRFYVSGAPVSWQDVLELNALGASVLSRSVIADPPPAEQVPTLSGYSDGGYTAAIVGLITVIAVLEVVLLAGPAFAVGARRQRRALALMAVGGGEPRHVRRVVLAQGLLVGGVVAVLAPPLGIGGAALLQPLLTRWFDASWGPFEVSIRDLVLVCLLGAGTALLAALVPAVLAGRQPVVAALQGRRTSTGRASWLTATGFGLLALGAIACYQALGQGFPEFWVAASAVPTVLGAAALAPAALSLAGRMAWRLPLPLRFAVRDADRQRGRTAPAVAAVTAVVAGVVALGTAVGSDVASQSSSYTPSALAGTAVVTVAGPGADYPALAAAARDALPGERVAVIDGVQATQEVPDGRREVQVCAAEPAVGTDCLGVGLGLGGTLGSPVLVGERSLAALEPMLLPGELARARQALADGRALVPGVAGATPVVVRLVEVRYDQTRGQESVTVAGRVELDAQPVAFRQGLPPITALLPVSTAQPLGGAQPVGLLVGDDLSGPQLERLQNAVRQVDTGAYAFVEQPDSRREDVRLVVLLLGMGAAALVLGGSLAATSLALTEARPDLATLGQIGARPRTRRLVSASYAFVLALVGALLGCLAGLVPGIAGAVAVSRGQTPGASFGMLVQYGGAALDVVDVPWLLLLSLVLLLPLLTGLVAGLAVRGSLPGTGRRATS